MKFINIVNTVEISKKFIKDLVKPGDIVADCTVGNGNDTLQLAKAVGPLGKVYGFDIQSEAIDITRDLLFRNKISEIVTLINDGHQYIDDYIEESLDFVIYNLGYLPGGDKKIRTNYESTISSIEKTLNLLGPGGLLIVTVYIGHEGGLEEKINLESLFSKLNQNYYSVLKHEFINQKNNPPILYAVEKTKKPIKYN